MGGTGKTTVSCALAKLLASTTDLKVLIVSTDPAHSLADAFDENMSSEPGLPWVMTGPLTAGRLSVCQVSAWTCLQSYSENMNAYDDDILATTLGVTPDILESTGLDELSVVLNTNNQPPGFGEIVALGDVLGVDNTYDVVVVDTAPTGHTLRLLALPQYLDGFLAKLMEFRLKISFA
jgi:arsenite-transporting ATPase